VAEINVIIAVLSYSSKIKPFPKRCCFFLSAFSAERKKKKITQRSLRLCGEKSIKTRRKSMYSEKVMEHFSNPRNIGEIKDADGVGEVGNPVCGDMMSFYINVKDNKIADIKFKTFGCVAAIAVSSMVTEMAMGKTLDEAKKITKQSVAESLDGLPKQKMHCSNLGPDALAKAIEDYESKH
jgi:nitrogen fixation protein NifU and related proteins